jgi:hypothetical protein
VQKVLSQSNLLERILVSSLFIIVFKKGNASPRQREPCFDELVIHCRWYFKSLLEEIMATIATSLPRT